MKIKYIVEFDDKIETYCSTKRAVLETIEEMIEDYSCENLSEKIMLKDIHVYEIVKTTKARDFQKGK